MLRLRVALAAVGLAMVASTVGVTAISAPANAGVLGCVGSALTLERDLRVDATHLAGNSLQNVTNLVSYLVGDVLTLNVTAIQAQAEQVVVGAANGTLQVSQTTVNDANATLTACRAS